MSQTTDYVLGHSDFEIERLQIQAAVLANITRRLIRECNVQPGMRVLDIGCGAGDVSMLLAEAVGPSGLVVAIDREARAVETARSRAEAAGHRNIEALVATIPSPDVAGRLVACFTEAGLPSPHLFCECVVGDPTSLIARWLALTYRAMLPHIVRLGLERASVGDPETLVERLEAELAAVRAQVVS